MEYETTIVAQPDWSADQSRQFCERLTQIVERTGGVVFLNRELGRRRLAYRIGKQTRGCYCYLNYGSNGEAVAELERVLRLDEAVLRYLTVQVGSVVSVETRRAKVLEDEARLAHLFGTGSEVTFGMDESLPAAGGT